MTLRGTLEGEKRYPDQRSIPYPFFAQVLPGGSYSKALSLDYDRSKAVSFTIIPYQRMLTGLRISFDFSKETFAFTFQTMKNRMWSQIARELELPRTMTSGAFTLKLKYVPLREKFQ